MIRGAADVGSRRSTDPLPAEPFFQSLVDAFDRASSAVASTPSFRIRIAGRTIAIEFAGNRLVDGVLPAFAHLMDGTTDPPDFVIRVFDSHSTGVTLPPPPWGPYDYLARGEIRGFNDGRFRTAYRIETGSLSIVDREARAGFFWIRDPALYPKWMEAAPLRTILNWWARFEGLQFVHGAAVGHAPLGVLITAPGGSGKSTTAIRCALKGFRYVGDDYVILDPSTLQVHSVYCSAKADDRSVERFFPSLRSASRGRISDDGDGKHVFYGSDVFPDALISTLTLSAVVVPRLVGDLPPRLSQISTASALEALAPTTVFQLAGGSSSEFTLLADVLRRVPCFAIDLPFDYDVTEIVGRVLTSSSARP